MTVLSHVFRLWAERKGENNPRFTADVQGSPIDASAKQVIRVIR